MNIDQKCLSRELLLSIRDSVILTQYFNEGILGSLEAHLPAGCTRPINYSALTLWRSTIHPLVHASLCPDVSAIVCIFFKSRASAVYIRSAVAVWCASHTQPPGKLKYTLVWQIIYTRLLSLGRATHRRVYVSLCDIFISENILWFGKLFTLAY